VTSRHLSQRAGFGEAPQQAFLRACGPAKISGVATPELLAVCAPPIHGANMGGVVSLYLRGYVERRVEKWRQMW
jgi:hypothetical protein